MFNGKKTRDPAVVKRTAELYKDGKTYAEIIDAILHEFNAAINTYDVECARDEYGLKKRHPLRRPRGAGVKALRHSIPNARLTGASYVLHGGEYGPENLR